MTPAALSTPAQPYRARHFSRHRRYARSRGRCSSPGRSTPQIRTIPFAFSPSPSPGPSTGSSIVGATLSDVDEALQRLFQVMVTIGPLVILLTTGAGWLLAGAALGPVEDMRREAAAVSASEPGRRLPVPPTGDELARLATTLNAMLDRLQEAIERERRFVDSASHELRTPLATLRAEIDLALIRKREHTGARGFAAQRSGRCASPATVDRRPPGAGALAGRPTPGPSGQDASCAVDHQDCPICR